MASITQIHAQTAKDLRKIGVIYQPPFECPECGATCILGLKSKRLCLECTLEENKRIERMLK
jgi:hypothetical protein